MNNEEEFRQFLEKYSNKTVESWKENIDAVVDSLDTGESLIKIIGVTKSAVSKRFRKQFKYWVPEKEELHYNDWVIFLLFKFDPNVKQCSKCNNIKSRDKFAKSSKERSGLRSGCKECEEIKGKIYRENNKANPAKEAAKAQKYRAIKKDLTPPWYDHTLATVLYTLSNSIEEKTDVDHVMPFHRLGLHIDWNLQILTEAENRSKGTNISQDIMDWYLDKLDEVRDALTKPDEIEWFDNYFERFVARNKDEYDTR